MTVLCAAFLVIIALRAWVGDDAYISFRTLDNFANGYGLRWNVHERVQSFTHPLWLLGLTPFYLLTGEIFLTSIGVSLVLSTLAVWTALQPLRGQALWVLPLAVLPIFFSHALIDYATSGLETPLTFLLLALLFRELFREGEPRALRLTLLVSLAATNRLDLVLFGLPTLIFLVARIRRPRDLRPLVLGSLPLAAWLGFSLFYYGSVFPNSRYAKLPANVELAWYLGNGARYLAELQTNDLVSALLLLAGSVICVLACVKWIRRRDGALGRLSLAGLGFVAYCVYVTCVGGDWMSGRFWAPSVFVATILLWRGLSIEPKRSGRMLALVGLVLLGFLAVRTLNLDQPWLNYESRFAGRRWHRIQDAREIWQETNSLRNYRADNHPAHQRRGMQGAELRREAWEWRHSPNTGRFVRTFRTIGMLGFYAGPDVIIVDRYGLGDALLARLGVENPERFRVGHGLREVPAGYLRAHSHGALDEMDEMLRRYYEPLRQIITGPLFDRGRLLEIVRFNLGRYDRYREAYESRPRSD